MKQIIFIVSLFCAFGSYSQGLMSSTEAKNAIVTLSPQNVQSRSAGNLPIQSLKVKRLTIDTLLKISSEGVAALIANKAELSYVNSQLATKTTTAQVNTIVLPKMDSTRVKALLALKADLTALNLKVDNTTFNSALSNKASTSDLALKANTADVNALLNFKVNNQLFTDTTQSLRTTINSKSSIIYTNKKLHTVATKAALIAYTDTDIVRFDGSDWERKSGNLASNGGTSAGTIINVSGSFYWERKTLNNTVNADDFETLKMAADALPAEGGTVILSKKEYLSPYLTNATRLTKSNVNFIGQGKPIYNSTFTKLINGTIIKGAFIATADNLSFQDLGVDSGSDFVGSTAQEGLVIKSLNSFAGDPLSKNIRVENCTFLVKAYNSAVHCLYFEGVTNGFINNVNTCFGGSGIVIKGDNNKVTNVNCKSHAQYSLLFKSDVYAITNNCIASNIEVSKASVSLTGDLIKGIYIQAAGSDCKNIGVSNFNVENCEAPITVEGLSPYYCKEIIISNGNIKNTTGSVIETIRCDNVAISYVKSNVSLYGATITATSTNVNLSFCDFIGSSSSAINQFGTSTKISNCVTNSTGRGIYFIAGTSTVSNHTDYSSIKFDILNSNSDLKFTGNIENIDAATALKIQPTNGQILHINSTSGVFSTVGFWMYENGAWVKSNAVSSVIGADASFSSPRLSLLGFSDTTPLQAWGNGGVVTTGIYRTSSNTMKMSTSNYGGSQFSFEGDYVFNNNLAINRNVALEKLDVNGAIKIANPYSTIVANATTPVPTGGLGTIVQDGGHFYGWNGSAWKQLDN